MSGDGTSARTAPLAYRQYSMIHDVYVLLDDGDRRVLSHFDLTLPQYRVLKLLDSQEGQRLTTLSACLLRAKSTITRIIDQLEAEGLARRTGDPADRRAQLVVLTPAGQERLHQAQQAHEEAVQQRFDRAFNQQEQEMLRQLLARLRDTLVQELHTAPDQDDHPG